MCNRGLSGNSTAYEMHSATVPRRLITPFSFSIQKCIAFNIAALLFINVNLILFEEQLNCIIILEIMLELLGSLRKFFIVCNISSVKGTIAYYTASRNFRFTPHYIIPAPIFLNLRDGVKSLPADQEFNSLWAV